MEMLLSGAVEDEHAGHLALHAPLSRARQILKARRSARRGVRTASAGLPSLGHRR
ncbi:hypothetical protein [Streptomyces californicus]|uniref:hypothetical protein n=1 Tax=Streptomyces californicus TaxID=67351 RepID=UPI0037152721